MSEKLLDHDRKRGAPGTRTAYRQPDGLPDDLFCAAGGDGADCRRFLSRWDPGIRWWRLAIACVKATLVVLFFMHIKYSSKLMKLTVGAGLFTFLILVGMSLSDYISRAWGQW
jgi:hypothetical protein